MILGFNNTVINMSNLAYIMTKDNHKKHIYTIEFCFNSDSHLTITYNNELERNTRYLELQKAMTEYKGL